MWARAWAWARVRRRQTIGYGWGFLGRKPPLIRRTSMDLPHFFFLFQSCLLDQFLAFHPLVRQCMLFIVLPISVLMVSPFFPCVCHVSDRLFFCPYCPAYDVTVDLHHPRPRFSSLSFSLPLVDLLSAPSTGYLFLRVRPGFFYTGFWTM